MCFGPIHASSVIIVIVVTVDMLVQHFMGHERLIGVKRVSDVRRNRLRSQIHLGVDAVVVALGVVIVKQIGLPVGATGEGDALKGATGGNRSAEDGSGNKAARVCFSGYRILTRRRADDLIADHLRTNDVFARALS